MLSQQVNAISEADVRTVCEAFNLNAGTIKLLGSIQNLVFSVNESSIVRFTHMSHRDENALKGEYEFVEHLCAHGIDAPKAYKLSTGGFFLPIERNGERFYASATAKARGVPVKRKDAKTYNERLFRIWGRTMGAMHTAVADYSPVNARFDYCDDTDFARGSELLKNRCGEAIARLYDETLARLASVEKSKDEYGTVHYDLHSSNFYFIDSADAISIFDFDDCVRAHFIGDIAVSVYSHTAGQYAKMSAYDLDCFIDKFIQPFLEGYCQAHALPRGFNELFPIFMLHRFLIIMIFIIKEFDSDDTDMTKVFTDCEHAVRYWLNRC